VAPASVASAAVTQEASNPALVAPQHVAQVSIAPVAAVALVLMIF